LQPAQAIQEFVEKKLATHRKFSGCTFIVSGPDMPGEGETKIFDFLRTNPAVLAIPATNVLIVGSDSDIVLMSLAIRVPNPIFVYKEMRPKDQVTSIGYLEAAFEVLFPGGGDGVKNDFVILSILQGNDYFPQLKGCSFASRWKVYKRLREAGSPFEGQCLVDSASRGFNRMMLAEFFRRLAARPRGESKEEEGGEGGEEKTDAVMMIPEAVVPMTVSPAAEEGDVIVADGPGAAPEEPLSPALEVSEEEAASSESDSERPAAGVAMVLASDDEIVRPRTSEDEPEWDIEHYLKVRHVFLDDGVVVVRMVMMMMMMVVVVVVVVMMMDHD
jgi:hypothetical protein